MDTLWSMSTTMRNPERALDFLKTVAEMDGEQWNTESQEKYQILLIKNRYYKPYDTKLSSEMRDVYNDIEHNLTFEEASQILAEVGYVDPDMRGRQSINPLVKLGLVSLTDYKIQITEFGRMFLTGEIDLGEMIFRSLIKLQLPNPLTTTMTGYSIKPFIAILHLIKLVNTLWEAKGEKPVGISRAEFGIFGLSMRHYSEINDTAKRLVAFRQKMRSMKNDVERGRYVDSYLAEYLSGFKNPHKNCSEYADNTIRYLRLTKYIYIRGGGYFIDLEPRRMIEINALLEYDNASAKEFTREDYISYMGNINAYELPFETIEKLSEIAKAIIYEIESIDEELGNVSLKYTIPSTKDELNKMIEELRGIRTRLQGMLIKKRYQDIAKIDEVIEKFKALPKLKQNAPLEFERLANITLNILNDAIEIKPNSPMGDDNKPTFTAPRDVADIECFYDGFGAVCEVTMLTTRSQWFNEGQPVMRHLRSFETKHQGQDNYCLFIAPRLHQDTINTYWNAVKYNYEGKRQKIVPITISTMVDILVAVRRSKECGVRFTKEHIRALYERCVDLANVNDSIQWQRHIGQSIQEWTTSLKQ